VLQIAFFFTIVHNRLLMAIVYDSSHKLEFTLPGGDPAELYAIATFPAATATVEFIFVGRCASCKVTMADVLEFVSASAQAAYDTDAEAVWHLVHLAPVRMRELALRWGRDECLLEAQQVADSTDPAVMGTLDWFACRLMIAAELNCRAGADLDAFEERNGVSEGCLGR